MSSEEINSEPINPTNPTKSTESTTSTVVEERKILSFEADGRNFAFEIGAVTDIIDIPEITAIPKVPPFIKGVINFRGKVVPIIDFRLKLGFPKAEYDRRSSIIIIIVNGQQVGIICDRVSDVEVINSKNYSPSPVKNAMIKGFVNIGDKRISLVNEDILTH